MIKPPSQQETTMDLREAFRFPLASQEARKDLLIGGTILWLLPVVGWILNLGHRLEVVYHIFHAAPPYYRGFRPWTHCFGRGLKAFCAICSYLSPALITALIAHRTSSWLYILAAALFCLAIFTLPGGMTYNAAYNDISYLYRPDKAWRRALEGGRAYLHAWGIALMAVCLSFVGLLGLGLGFFYTSVWAWMVVGYVFSRALSLQNTPP